MIKTKYNKMFLAPEGDEGGGGEVSRGVAATGEGVPPSEPAAGGDSPAAPAGMVNAKELAAELGDVLRGFSKEPQTPTQQKEVAKALEELTPEERTKMFKVLSIDENYLRDFDNLDTKKSALEKLRDSILESTDGMTQYRLNGIMKQIEELVSPALSFVTEQKEQQLAADMVKSYPGLGDEKLEPVVEAVKLNLSKQGKRFDTAKELYAAIAKGVEEVIQVHNPQFKISAGSNPAARKPSGRSIPVTSTGSDSGAASDGNTPPTKRGVAVFQR